MVTVFCAPDRVTGEAAGQLLTLGLVERPLEPCGPQHEPVALRNQEQCGISLFRLGEVERVPRDRG
jgi:hypothetical protein